MDTILPWFGGAAAISMVVACWSRIQFFARRLASLLVVTVTVEEGAADALSLYCWAKLKRSPFGERRYRSMSQYVRPLRRVQQVAYEQIGRDPIVFWRGWRPILIGRRSAGREDTNAIHGPISITCVRGLFDIDALLTDAMDLYNERQNKGAASCRFTVRRLAGLGAMRNRHMQSEPQTHGGSISHQEEQLWDGRHRVLKWRLEQLGVETRDDSDPFDALAFSPDVMDIVEDARQWFRSERWYRDRTIPWTRGWLLCGPPGTGKTSLARAVAQDMDLPVFVFDLATMGNAELVSSWADMMASAPCVALFEDIDAVFDGRRNVLGEQGGGLTFDCLLNCLSGIQACDGVFKVVTSNNPDKLDPALGVAREGDREGISTRPGRIDRVLVLGALDEECRRRIAERILRDWPAMIDRVVDEGDGDTAAQFQERCVQLALRRMSGQPASLHLAEVA